MIVALAETALNLWLYGVPIVALAVAVLHAIPHAHPRVRYVLVVGAFVAAVVLPLVPERADDAAAVTAMTASEAPPVVPLAERAIRSAKVPLVALWLSGAVVLLVREAAGHLHLRSARRRAVRASIDVHRAVRCPAEVPLYISTEGPLTAGALRPWVMIPDTAIDEAAVRHELAHARWRDPLVHATLRAVASLFWIAPLWPLVRIARREREVAADHAAIADGVRDRIGYVEVLLAAARPEAAANAGARMAQHDLVHRVRCILEPAPRGSWLVAVALAAAGTTGVLALSPVRFYEPPEPMKAVLRVTSTRSGLTVTPVRPEVVPGQETPEPTANVRGAVRDAEVETTIDKIPQTLASLAGFGAPGAASVASVAGIDDRPAAAPVANRSHDENRSHDAQPAAAVETVHRDVHISRHVPDRQVVTIRSVIRN